MPNHVIDAHVHVGLAGDEWPHLGGFSAAYKKSAVFRIFLAFARLSEDDVTDTVMCDRTLDVIARSRVDQVVCLALDPIYDAAGTRRSELSHVWVDNRYITDKLRPQLPNKILFGASVHPYDPDFESRVKDCVDAGAVLIKWLPSAQEFTLADGRVREAMIFLATAKKGKPLPLLLHTGSEYAIPPHDPKTKSYDFLSWTWRDRIWNALRSKNAWYSPNIKQVTANLEAALAAGAVVIFAHCGAPYFSAGVLGGLAEHSDFNTVCRYLERTGRGEFAGSCFADLSAFIIPTRVPFFDRIRSLPPDLLVMGSDFPVPITELSAGPAEWWDDFRAILMEGRLDRLVIPEDNLLDVNRNELHRVFGDHPMFSNFARL